jgi:cellulose synthase/poly-beta-1,6-N-acetylglucosamine synthase-like glycosyltransferase
VALFWSSVGAVIYGYVGFPLLVAVRALARPRPVRSAAITPPVSVLVAAHNEADVIAAKLDNLATLDYPADALEVLVASDGSTDATVEIARGHSSKPKVLDLPRRGKNHALNDAAAIATGTIIVVSDADSILEPGAMRALAAYFADPEVGGVAGSFRYRRSDRGGDGERAYWNFDRIVKQLQTRSGSATSSTGQLHALRRDLWSPLPGGVADDSYESLGVIAQGHRLVYASDAVASGDVEADAAREYDRKVRYITRGLRSVWLRRELLDPRRHGWFALQLLSHKVLRRLVALPIAVLAVVSPTLWRRGRWYRAATATQLLGHGLALMAWLRPTADPDERPGMVRRVARIALYVDLTNIAVLRAVWDLWREPPRDVWTPHRGDRSASESESEVA